MRDISSCITQLLQCNANVTERLEGKCTYAKTVLWPSEPKTVLLVRIPNSEWCCSVIVGAGGTLMQRIVEDVASWHRVRSAT